MGATVPEWRFREAWIRPELRSANAIALLEELAAPIVSDLDSDARAAALQALREREKLGSTAMGDGVAVPHAKVPGLDTLRVGFGRHPRGVDFDAPDGQPVQLFFVILSPAETPGQHLQTLAQIARITRDPAARELLLSVPADQLAETLNRLLEQARDG